MSPTPLSDTGVVVIGRNEGERLRRCLTSCRGHARRIVYADSGSTDGSCALARELGAEVVELDLSRPANAARGRNAGLERLLELEPDLPCCFFIDGDCELADGFLEAARAELVGEPGLGGVCGRRREIDPGASLFNRLVDAEWNTPLGATEACGGDALFRVAALRATGGYDEGMSCGEDPELSHRIRRQGFGLLRIEHEMTRHDVALHRFGPWWKRHARGGYAYMHGCAKHWGEPGNYNRRTCLSIVLYGLFLPLVCLASLPLFLVGHGGVPVVTTALAAAAYLRLWIRVRCFRRDQGDDARSAGVYAAFVVLGKFAELQGLASCLFDLALGRRSLVCEYKDYQRRAAA